MPYNITEIKDIKIDTLIIPVRSLYKHIRTDWHPKRENFDDGGVKFNILETSLSGVMVDDDRFCVLAFDCIGEGSGTAMRWIYEPALSDSTGSFEALFVYESGDLFTHLTVKDGDVEWNDIDI